MSSAKYKAIPANKTPIIIFKVQKYKTVTKKRATYSPERRKEVKAVRKNRACLRCSLLKIKCNSDDVCITCSKLILHVHYKQVLSFSGCIRTRLVEVNFFEAYIPLPAVRDLVLAKADNLASTVISLQFASKITWDLKVLINDFVAWLYGSIDSDTSKVGILSSPEFLELISSSVKDCERTNFQRMIYAESLAYTEPTSPNKHYLSIPELRQIGAIAGHEVLKYLDNKLKPQSLGNCSYNDIQALFLLVLGTILAISYTMPSLEDRELLNEEAECTPQLVARHYHLCQILAHYMVYLGSHLKIPVSSHSEQFLLEAAPARCHKRGRFQWSSGPEDETDLTKGRDSEDSRFEIEGYVPTSMASLPDNVPNPKDFADVEHRPSTQRYTWSDQSDAWPNMIFDRADSSYILNAESAFLLDCQGVGSECQTWASSFQVLPSEQPLISTRASAQYRSIHRDSASQNGDTNALMALPPGFWNGTFQLPLDISAESVGIVKEKKPEFSASKDDQKLFSEEDGLTNQSQISLQSIQFTPRKRRALDLSRRKAVANIRRKSSCASCYSRHVICAYSVKTFCSRYLEGIKSFDSVYFWSQHHHLCYSHELATGSYISAYSGQVNATGQQIYGNGTTARAKAEKKRQLNSEAMNLLV